MLAQSVWFGPVAGLLVGLGLGWAARWGRFCTLGALERAWYGGDDAGLRTLFVAAAVAMAATQGLHAAGVIDLSQSAYLAPRLPLFGLALGGLMFGFGMALVGACGFSALVQLGGGSLRALVALVTLGIVALAAAGGVLAPLARAAAEIGVVDLSFAGDGSIGGLASALLGADLRGALAVGAPLALAAWAFAAPRYRAQRRAWGAGVAVGLLIALGWALTAHEGAHGFGPAPLESASFVGPVGDFLLAVIAFSGVRPDFGVGLVAGVALGAAAAAWRRQDMRWEACDDARELGRHMGGAALMGMGGVLAHGCTIGQGLSAFSALALSAPVAILFIALGARLGLAWLVEGSVRHAFTALAPTRAAGQPGGR